MTNVCVACEKKFKTEKYLHQHTLRSEICRKWISYLNVPKPTFDSKVIERIQKVYENIKPIDTNKHQCYSCHKQFSTKSNLNKHIKRNIICQKWEKYHTIQERNEDYNNIKTCENNIYSSFEPLPQIPMHHIVWNLYLTDKESKIESYSKHNIDYVICIMPKENFLYYTYDTEKEKTKFYNLSYNDHKQTFEDTELQGYEKMCMKLLELQKKRKNALIVCNNGYQRSLPFICYYLIKYHNEEYPTVEKTIELILSQVDRNNMSLKDKYVKCLKKLNFINTN